MHELILKIAELATDYDVSGAYKKADRVDRFLELIAIAKLELQILEDELIEE